MPIANNLKTKKNTPANLTSIRIHSSKNQTAAVPMLNEKVAPAGIYISKIAAITASKIERTQSDAIDVTYELTDSSGKVVQGRVRYEIGSYHFDRLGDALIAAGLPEGSSIVDAVGIEETLEIVYPQRNSLAKIKSRRPLSVAKAQQTKAVEAAEVDEEDDFDDFLPDEDEDDF